MKKAIVLLVALLLVCGGASAERVGLPGGIAAYLQETYPGCEILMAEGFDGGYVIVLGGDGLNRLIFMERKAGETEYRVTLQNDNALRKGDTLPEFKVNPGGNLVEYAYRDNAFTTNYSITRDENGWGFIVIMVYSSLENDEYCYFFDGDTFKALIYNDVTDGEAAWSTVLLTAYAPWLGSTPATFDINALPGGDPRGPALNEIAARWLEESLGVNTAVLDAKATPMGVLAVVRDDAGQRALAVAETASDGVRVIESAPLPEDASVDWSGTWESPLTVSFINNGLHTAYGVAKQADGAWRVTGVSGADNFGISVFGLIDAENRWRVGTLAGTKLDSLRWEALPATWEQAAAQLDQSGWARVTSDDPANRLHLRDEPNREAKSLAKFYMGTPVRVVREYGDWVEVEVYGGLYGYMMKRWLVFGDAMNGMQTAFPQILGQQEWLTDTPFDAADAVIIGAANNDSYYVVFPYSGNYGFFPEKWFTQGN